MKTAVVGHVEWVEFARVKEVPEPGDIVHASETFELPAGGGAVAAMQLARLESNCVFLTAAGDDQRGEKMLGGLRERGLRVEATRHRVPQRRAFVYLDDRGERTITTIGRRLAPRAGDELPWAEMADVDAVYFTAGGAEALRAARRARLLVATVRVGAPLSESGVQLDVLVASANDKAESYSRGGIEPEPRWVVRTDGSRGGTLETADGRISDWQSRPPSSPRVDSYGAGDSFAGGLTYGLGRGWNIETAISFGAFCGAGSVRGRGPYEGHVNPEELKAWERESGLS